MLQSARRRSTGAASRGVRTIVAFAAFAANKP